MLLDAETDPEGPFDPAESEVEFLRSPTRKVHVQVPLHESDLFIGDIAVTPFTALMLGWNKTLCGIRTGREWFGTLYFPDEALCRKCVKLMGEHSDRLFDPEREDSW